MAHYKLKLKSLKFISPVDKPAQETATALLIKRAGGATTGTAKVVKVSEELGLVFCWAFTSKAAGKDYEDLHGDTIDGDFVKVCAEFMDGARAVDEMHDGAQTGKTVFGMPMTAEIAKAFGFETDTEGFMVAIKPAPEVFAKFKSGEYTGVSIEGTGIREEVSLAKRAALTTAVSGHTHMIFGIDEMQAGSTSTEAMPGTEYGYHSHPWVRAEDGSIAIGEQQGHTHALAGLSSESDPGEAVEMRAPHGFSTAAPTRQMVKGVTHQTHQTTQEPTTMKDIATLKKMLASALALPEAHRAHAATLDDSELEAFLAKSATDRESIVKAAGDADPVIYKRLDGTEIRKSHGQLLADVAKQADDAMKLAASEVAKREEVELAKRADKELSHFSKGQGARVALLKAVCGIADEKVRGEVHEMLAAANAACVELTKAQGANPGADPEPTSKRADLKRAVEEFAKTNGGLPYETAFVKAISSDPKVRSLYEDVRAEG